MLWDRPIRRNHGESHPTQLTFVAAQEQSLSSEKSEYATTFVWHSGHCTSARMENDRETRTIDLSLKTPHAFWHHLSTRVSPSRPVWIFCHDVPHTFTLLGGWQRWRQGEIGVRFDEIEWEFPGVGMTPERCKPGLIVDNDPPVIFDLWHRCGGRIVWCDTRNYWNTRPPEFKSPGEECDWVKANIIGLWREHKRRELGNWTYTAAGLGWNAWRHKFMTQSVYIHGDNDCDELERKAYYGGWTESFVAGQIRQPLAQIDVNGMYPFIMGTRPLPIQLERFETRRSADNAIVFSEPQRCIAEVRINSETERFPRRTGERSSELCCGEFSTTLCGPELVRAIATNSVVGIARFAVYKLNVIFAEFARYMTEMRTEARRDGNDNAATLVKAMSVGLYGRFARRTPKWQAVADEGELPSRAWSLTPQQLENWREFVDRGGDPNTVVRGTAAGKVKELRCVGRHWQRRIGTERHKDSFTAIAAFTTAWGREYMRGLIDIAHESSVYRVATDSIIVDKHGYDRLDTAKMIHETSPGLLKVERFGETADFRGVHSFRLGDHFVHGGISEYYERFPDGTCRDWRKDRLDTLIKTVNSSAFRGFYVDIKPLAGYTSDNAVAGCRLPIRRFPERQEWTNGQRDPEQRQTDETGAD